MTLPIHSPTGASSMERWEQCPGSIRLSTGLPEPEQSEAAKEGTLAHEWAERALNEKPWPIGNSEMHQHVATYVAICNSYFQPQHQQLGAERGIEFRFDLTWLIAGMYGTSDYWVYWPWLKKLVVLDFKYGAGVYVSAKDNPQLLYYALGVILSHPHFDIDTIELGIVQPRCTGTDQQPFRSVEVPIADMWAFRLRLIRAIAATTAPDAPLKTGEHCRWCRAAAICPEKEKERDLVLQSEFQTLTISQSYNPQKLSEALDRREMLKAYLKALDEFALTELQAGKLIPGYKLVNKKGERSFKSMADFKAAMAKAGYQESDWLTEPEVMSPAALEKKFPPLKKVFKDSNLT
ncbi:MAG TPA: DUF2800 domain-containing protein, partial [Nitrosospira sp.]